MAMRIAPGYVADGWQRQDSDSSQAIAPGVNLYRKPSATIVNDPTADPFKATGIVKRVSPMTLAMFVTEKQSDIQVQCNCCELDL